MKTVRYYLKDYYPELGENGCNAALDCYIPDEMKEIKLGYDLRPALLICPGGGYQMLSEREAEPIALNFLSEGYCAFVIRYSVHPNKFPQQLLEVAGAMELIHAHANEWACDKDNVAIMGFSAGGHLAAQYSNRYDCPEIRRVFPESKPVQKSILSYPVITWEKGHTHTKTIQTFVGHEPEDGYEMGCACELLVSDKTPPAFIWATSEDAVVPVENSLRYAMALTKYHIPYELHIYPYGYHGLSTVDDQTCVNLDERYKCCHKWIEDCKRWMRMG